MRSTAWTRIRMRKQFPEDYNFIDPRRGNEVIALWELLSHSNSNWNGEHVQITEFTFAHW